MLVGRAQERAHIDRLLAGARAGCSSPLVLSGEAGIGKTALLEYAAGAGRDFRVLRTVGVQAESAFAFSGLMQLVRPVLGALEALPEAQRDALERSLGLGEAGERRLFLSYAGALSLLAAAAAQEPLLLLVDDVHWLDASSAEALGFVARRLEAEQIALVFARRPAAGGPFDPRGLEEIDLGGLPEGDARELLAAGREPMAPAVANRVIAETGGNPLALIEVPSMLTADQRAGHAALDDPLPVGEALEQAFYSQAGSLSDRARQALLIAAASDSGRLEAILQAAGGDAGAIDEAESAGLVRVHGGELTFRHPLVRSAVYFGAPSGERRAAHAALARALGPDDHNRRAWHLSEAVLGPDEAIAKALDAAGAEAGARCSEDEARLLERAALLSPDPARRVSRLLRAGQAAQEAGLSEEALALLERGLAVADDPRVRADLQLTRLRVARATGHFGDLIETCLVEAKRVEAFDPQRAASLLYHAHHHAFERFDLDRSRELIEKASAMVNGADDEATLPVLSGVSLQAVADGRVADALAAAERGAELELERERMSDTAVPFAECLAFLERYELSRSLLERLLSELRARGAVVELIRALAALTSLELRQGRVAQASVAAHEAVTLAQEWALSYWEAWSLARLASVEAVLGREQEGRDHVRRAAELSSQAQDRETQAHCLDALGRLELGLANVAQAVSAFERVAALTGAIQHPAYLLWIPDLIEAELRSNRRERALELLGGFAAMCEASPHSWATAAEARCRALLAPDAEVDDRFTEAHELARQENVSAFERGRVELLWGERLRRAGRRLDSRARLRSALAQFESLGATSWAERTREELRASGERTRRGDSSVFDRLTPRELEVALLAAEGHSNREIGARLFLSPKTVELHLGRSYRKLGIHSRTELGRALPRAEGDPLLERVQS